MKKGTVEIVFCTSADPERGAPHHAMLGLWLASRGWRVLILSAGRERRSSLTSPLGTVENRTIPGGRRRLGRILWQLRFCIALLGLRIQEGRAVFVIEGSPATPSALVALLGMRRSRCVYQTQDYLEPRSYPLRSWVERRFAKRAGLVVSNEPARARFFASYYRLSKVPFILRTALPRSWTVPSRCEETRSRLISCVNTDVGEDTKLVLHQGGYSRTRCSRPALEALALLPKSYKFVFTGVVPGTPGSLELARATKELSIDGRVIVTEFLPFEELLLVASACDVGLLLYPNDGIGNFFQAPGRLTEYLRAGVPVVASNFPGLELLVCKFTLGATCESDDAQTIAAAISEVCDQPLVARQARSDRLRVVAETILNYDTGAERLEKELVALAQRG